MSEKVFIYLVQACQRKRLSGSFPEVIIRRSESLVEAYSSAAVLKASWIFRNSATVVGTGQNRTCLASGASEDTVLVLRIAS
jgi:hypothetical protein